MHLCIGIASCPSCSPSRIEPCSLKDPSRGRPLRVELLAVMIPERGKGAMFQFSVLQHLEMNPIVQTSKRESFTSDR